MQVVEAHPFEERSTGLYQVLLGGLGNLVEGFRRVCRPPGASFDVPNGVPIGTPGLEDNQVSVIIRPIEHLATVPILGKPLQPLPIGEEEKRVQRCFFPFDWPVAGTTKIKGYPGRRVLIQPQGVYGHQVWRGIRAKKQSVGFFVHTAKGSGIRPV
jgi:hypothetical protein